MYQSRNSTLHTPLFLSGPENKGNFREGLLADGLCFLQRLFANTSYSSSRKEQQELGKCDFDPSQIIRRAKNSCSEDSCVCNAVQHYCKICHTPPSFTTQRKRKRKRRWRWKSRTLHFLVRGQRGNTRLGHKHGCFKWCYGTLGLFLLHFR